MKHARHIVTSDLTVSHTDGSAVHFTDGSWIDLSNGRGQLCSATTIAWRPTWPYLAVGFLKPDPLAPKPRRGSLNSNVPGTFRNFTRWG